MVKKNSCPVDDSKSSGLSQQPPTQIPLFFSGKWKKIPSHLTQSPVKRSETCEHESLDSSSSKRNFSSFPNYFPPPSLIIPKYSRQILPRIFVVIPFFFFQAAQLGKGSMEFLLSLSLRGHGSMDAPFGLKGAKNRRKHPENPSPGPKLHPENP